MPRRKLRFGREKPAKEKKRKNYGDEIRGAAGHDFGIPGAICCPILTREQIYREGGEIPEEVSEFIGIIRVQSIVQIYLTLAQFDTTARFRQVVTDRRPYR